jgi:starch synthase
MIASECAPVAKIGGLGDVVYGLSTELTKRGNAVDIILPKYDCMRYDQLWGLEIAYENLWVGWYDGAICCTVYYSQMHGQNCFFIEPHSNDNFFNRGGFYGYHDDPMRFAFFNKAALEFMLKTNKRPDVIHCHDWQTGLIAPLLFEMYQFQGMDRQRVCYTIHNIKHQGTTGAEVLKATGLNREDYYFHYDRMRDNFNPFALNFMKAGIVYSNFVTTVSPQYAWEIRFSDMSYGLGHTLEIHQNKFGGVLNGIDYGQWNPEIDPFIACHYSRDDITPKYANKNALRNRLMLQDSYKPILAYIGRLDTQKGVHLVRHALFYALDNGCQFVLLGVSPEQGINDEFWHLKHHMNDHQDCHLEIGFDEELAHLIYAGSDMLVVPSLFEPCGLTQMLALKYGSVPIVRGVGGLVNTVFDVDYCHDKPLEGRNGYVFYDADYPSLESALQRAIGLWYNYPEKFQQLIRNGMNYDYSWYHQTHHYTDIYDYIRCK